MSSKPEPAMWSRDTGQRIYWYDNCQLKIIRMFNIKVKCCTPRLHDLVLARWPICCVTSLLSLNACTLLWSMPLAMLTIKKELHGFLFLSMHTCGSVSIYYGAPFGGSSSNRAPLLYWEGLSLFKLLFGSCNKFKAYLYIDNVHYNITMPSCLFASF